MKKVLYSVMALAFAFVSCNEPEEPVYDYFEVLTQEGEFELPNKVEGEGVLEVTVKADYPEFEVNVDGEWLTYVPAAKSEADAVESVLKFTYDSNEAAKPRTATISITSGKKELASFVVTQAAREEIKAVWIYTVAQGGKMEALHPAVDALGNVYVTETGTTSLYKILPDGNLGWKKEMVPSSESADPWSGQISVPSLEADGSVVYAGGGTAGNGSIFAFNTADGSVKWEFSSDMFWAANNGIPNPKINRLNVAVGKDCVYAGNGGTTGTALAINKTTGERVSFVSGALKDGNPTGPTGGTNVGMSITKGGTVMFRGNYGAFAVSSSSLDNPGEDGFVTYNSRYYDKTMKQNNANIACFTKDGKDHFAMFGTNDDNGMKIIWGPVDATSELAYYAADGTEPTWTTHEVATKKQDQGGLVIGAKGEIIVTLKKPGSVYAVDPATNQMAWIYDTNVEMGGSPAVDAAGNVHVYDDYGKYYILKPNYETKTAELVQTISLLDLYAEETGTSWNEGDRCKAYGAPIIGKDGKIYLSVYYRDGAKAAILSAVFCLDTGLCTGAGDTPWPLKNGDCFNSGNQAK